MQIHYYKARSLAEAFEAASKDTKTWNFPEMEALTELATDARGGSLRGMQQGIGTLYVCNRGTFKVNADPVKGFGIALLALKGRESGIADPVAAEILEYHRDRPDQELYAEQLLVYSEHVKDMNALDKGYELLVRAWFLVRTEATIQITVGDTMVDRPKYRLRRPMEPIGQLDPIDL